MNQPQIELRAIKHFASMSEETHCFTATLIVDGEKWGEISNHGHGGCDEFHGVPGKNWADIKALDERIAATHPKIDCTDIGAPGTTITPSLEILCGDIVNAFLAERDVKRLLKSKLAFFKSPTATDLFTVPLKTHSVEKMSAYVRTKNPAAVILNEMPLADAITAYQKGPAGPDQQENDMPSQNAALNKATKALDAKRAAKAAAPDAAIKDGKKRDPIRPSRLVPQEAAPAPKKAKPAPKAAPTAPAAPAKPAKAPGQRAAIEAAARAGTLPTPPDFSAETHKRFRPTLERLVAAAGAGDLAALKAETVERTSSSRKAMGRYQDLAIMALEAQAAAGDGL